MIASNGGPHDPEARNDVLRGAEWAGTGFVET